MAKSTNDMTNRELDIAIEDVQLEIYLSKDLKICRESGKFDDLYDLQKAKKDRERYDKIVDGLANITKELCGEVTPRLKNAKEWLKYLETHSLEDEYHGGMSESVARLLMKYRFESGDDLQGAIDRYFGDSEVALHKNAKFDKN